MDGKLDDPENERIYSQTFVAQNDTFSKVNHISPERARTSGITKVNVVVILVMLM